MPSVHDERHAELQSDVMRFAESLGFITDEATYHTVMGPETVRRLQFLDTETTLYIRGRADRICVHKTQPIAFEVECKTKPPSSGGKDWTIEAHPLAIHCMLSVVAGVDCLYAYRDVVTGFECGFWCSEIPPIRDLFFTSRNPFLQPRIEQMLWYGSTFWCSEIPPIRDLFFTSRNPFLQPRIEQMLWYGSTDYNIKKIQSGAGSNDHFAVIDISVARNLPNWRSLLTDRIATTPSHVPPQQFALGLSAQGMV